MLNQPVLADTQQLLQLIDYVGVDYAEAVQNKAVINEAEYAEMLDFAAGISQHLMALPESPERDLLVDQSDMLKLWVKQKQSAAQVRQLTSEMHQAIIVLTR